MEEELKKLEALRLKSEIDLNNAERGKVELESNQITASNNIPLYRSPTLVKALITGVSITLVIAGYIHYAFIPATNSLENQLELVSFNHIRDKKLDELARKELDIKHAILEQEKILTETALSNAQKDIEKAKKEVSDLQSKIANLKDSQFTNGNKGKVGEFKEIVKIIEETKKDLERAGTNIKDSQENLDMSRSVADKNTVENTGTSGWVYLGFKPSSGWGYRNIAVSDDEDISETNEDEEKKYKVINTINVRDDYPKLGLFGYKFGKVQGYISRGSFVKVLELKVVGFSKVWAKVNIAEME